MQVQNCPKASVVSLPGASRQQWVDVARGLGIILVVYAHVLLGHFGPDESAWVSAQATLIYAFHMPLFFVLSGLFVWPSLRRDSFLSSRWSQIIYPYLLWSMVTIMLEMAVAPYVNSPISIREALLIPFVPLEQFWFLYTLLVCQLLALFSYPRKSILVLFAFLGTGLLAVVGGEWIVIRSFHYLPYLLIGIIGKRAFEELAVASRGRQLAVAGASWGIFVVLWLSGVSWPLFLFGALGGVGTIAVAMLADQITGLGDLGRASFAIYLLHTIFSAGMRIALNLLGLPPASSASVIFSILAGIIIPYTIWVWAKRTDRLRILGFGA